MLRMAGDVPVDRPTAAKRQAMLQCARYSAVRAVRRLLPEGNAAGELLPFNEGPFCWRFASRFRSCRW
jgi:hypothetical protein